LGFLGRITQWVKLEGLLETLRVAGGAVGATSVKGMPVIGARMGD